MFRCEHSAFFLGDPQNVGFPPLGFRLKSKKARHTADLKGLLWAFSRRRSGEFIAVVLVPR